MNRSGCIRSFAFARSEHLPGRHSKLLAVAREIGARLCPKDQPQEHFFPLSRRTIHPRHRFDLLRLAFSPTALRTRRHSAETTRATGPDGTTACCLRSARHGSATGSFFLPLVLAFSLFHLTAFPVMADAVPSGEDWWSLQPVRRAPVPTNPPSPSPHVQARNAIDAFVFDELRRQGLSSSPEADRRTLLRRLYFDLLGLLPPPEEMNAFLKDSDPLAFERRVDRLLASPQYGERWARHWLDLVHFGETHGYDKDKPRPHAWPYRDYVIRALNEAKPFSRFLQEQLAGDVLYPRTRDGVEALGFIAAGPWDFIGHAEVPETKIDGKVARHLDRDDMVVNALQTFTSLTVQCAQCHHHKFDPVSMEDYYSLQAVFAAIDRTEVRYDRDDRVAAKRHEIDQSLERARQAQNDLRGRIQQRDPARFEALDREITAAEGTVQRQAAFGFHSQIAPKPDDSKWVQIDLGVSQVLRQVVLHAAEDDFNGIGKGFGFPPVLSLSTSDDPEFKDGVTILTRDFQAGTKPKSLTPVIVECPPHSKGRYLRVTAHTLALRQNDYIFALAELEVFSNTPTNAALKAKVTALDSIENAPRWARSNLTDGYWPGQVADGSLAQATLTRLRGERDRYFHGLSSESERQEFREGTNQLEALRQASQALPPLSLVYAGAVHTGKGSFKGTGAEGGKPRTVHVLQRGNIVKPGVVAQPAPVRSVPGVPNQFDLPPNHAESARRAALARWMSHPDHPLVWRSIVNRVWQHHFGRGLVETPNDFGRMGARPTHPALLDWLASEFRDGGQSLKTLSRLILTSHTYRQSSDSRVDASARDADNRFLWRMNRKKLDAESVRDAALQAAGALDPRMHGPSFQDFVIEKPEHSPHYQYHLHDPRNPASHRRSVYRFLVRSQPQPFMASLDCADPSMQVAKRNETLSPTQALSMMNHPHMLAMASIMAARLPSEAPELEQQIDLAHRRILSRPPSRSESEALLQFTQKYGLPNLCRMLFNLNEFLFID